MTRNILLLSMIYRMCNIFHICYSKGSIYSVHLPHLTAFEDGQRSISKWLQQEEKFDLIR